MDKHTNPSRDRNSCNPKKSEKAHQFIAFGKKFIINWHIAKIEIL